MPLPQRKIYFHIFYLHIIICLRYFYLQYYIYIYICKYIFNILFKSKALFTCKSEDFLLIIGITLSVLLRPDKNLQGFDCPFKLCDDVLSSEKEGVCLL
jgi:hypothetical protein